MATPNRKASRPTPKALIAKLATNIQGATSVKNPMTVEPQTK